MRLFTLLLFLFLTANALMSQELYPNLTKKMEGTADSLIPQKIEKIYTKAVAKDPKEEGLLQLWKFTMYDSLGYVDIADSLGKELVDKANEIHHPKVSDLYLFVGNQYYNENDFQKGILLMHKALDVSRSYKDLAQVSVILKEIGVAYRKINDLKNAEKYLRDALAVAKRIKDDLQIGNVYMALGNALREKGDNKNALVCFQKSLELGLKLKNDRLLAGNYNNLGLIEQEYKNYSEALKYFNKALKINKTIGNKLWESFNYHNMGNTYDNLKQYQKAIEFYKLSSNLKIELGDSLSLLTGYLNISSSSKRKGDFATAYDYLNKYLKLKDTLNIKEQSNLLKDLEAKYESDKKQREIEHLKMSSDLQKMKNDSLQMKAQKNRNISILSILVALSLVVVIIILWKSNKRRKEINGLLNTKNNEIEVTNLSLNTALNELSIKNKEVIDSINYATYIQQAALPSISQLSSDLLHLELFFAPKDIVSGDFYFSYKLYKKSFFGVADCTGHGVPGAMVSLVGMNSLDKVVREENHDTTASMVESLNHHVISSLQRGGESINDGMDISFCYIDHEKNRLHFTGANHNAYLLRSKTEVSIQEESRISIRLSNDHFDLYEMEGIRRPIGESISQEPFQEVQVEIRTGDRIVLFSDGYADQVGGEHLKKLKKGNLLSSILNSGQLDVKKQLEHMKTEFSNWKGDHEQVDDVCLLIVNVE